MKLPLVSVDVGTPSERHAWPTVTHSRAQQGFEVDGSLVALSYEDELKGRLSNLPRRRLRFYMVTTVLAIFALVASIALLLSSCTGSKTNRVTPHFAGRRLSDNGASAAAASQLRKMCEELARELSSASFPKSKHERIDDIPAEPTTKMLKLDIRETKATGTLPATSAGPWHHGPRHAVTRVQHQQPQASTSASFLASSRTRDSSSASEFAASSGLTFLDAQMPLDLTAQHLFSSHLFFAEELQRPAVFVLPEAEQPQSTADLTTSESVATFEHTPSVSQTATGQEQATQGTLLPSSSSAHSQARSVEHASAQHWLSSDPSFSQQHQAQPVAAHPHADMSGSTAGLSAVQSLAMLGHMPAVSQTATGQEQATQGTLLPSSSSAHSSRAVRAHAVQHATAQHWLSSDPSSPQQHQTQPVAAHPYADLSGSTAGLTVFHSVAMFGHTPSVSQTATGQEQATQGILLPSSSSADSSDTDDCQASSCSDLFWRLPVVLDPANYTDFFESRLVSEELLPSRTSVIHFWKPVALLLCEESMPKWRAGELAGLTRKLIAYISSQRIVGSHGGSWKNMAFALTHRFLTLDTVVSAMKVLQVQRRGKLWNDIIARFPEDYPTKRRGELVQSEMELIEALKGAIATLKRGDRPSDETLRDVKKMLFCLPSSPSKLVNSNWNIWRIYSEGQEPTQTAEDCSDIFCRLPVILERRDYAALFDPERHVEKREECHTTLESNWEEVARLLLKKSLSDVKMKKLVYYTENLVASIKKHRVIGRCRRTETMVWHMARRYLILDALVSALHIIRVPLDRPWWEGLITRFPEDYSRRQSLLPSGSELELFHALRRGIATLKTGRRPSDDELVHMKTQLFCLPSSPSKLVHSTWNIWRCSTEGATALQESSQPSTSSSDHP